MTSRYSPVVSVLFLCLLQLILAFTASSVLLWLSVPTVSANEPTTTTSLDLTPRPAGEGRKDNKSLSSTNLKSAETFHRGSVVAAFDEIEDGTSAAFADAWLEVDERENVGQEEEMVLNGLGDHHGFPSDHPRFPTTYELEDPLEQSYECVLVPKRPPYSREVSSSDEHNQVQHLYGIDSKSEEQSSEENLLSKRHQAATKRKAKSAFAPSAPKLRDFGNFLYVDDTARPTYTELVEVVSSSPPTPKKKHYRKSLSSSSSSFIDKPPKKKTKKKGKEIDQLFIKLKSSLDQLLCYQNEECYGGAVGISGEGGDEKLEAFIRHVRASKKVFELLEKNQQQLMADNDEMMIPSPPVSSHPEVNHQPTLHLPHRFVALDPRAAFGGGPVAPMYMDSIQRSMAVKAPFNSRKNVPHHHHHSMGKYFEASSNALSSTPSAVQHRRLPARSVVSSSSFGNSLGALPISKLGRSNLISSLLSGGANLFFNRAAAADGGWQTKRQWAPQADSNFAASSSAAYRPPIAPVFSPRVSSWPKPVLVIKEYEEYNE